MIEFQKQDENLQKSATGNGNINWITLDCGKNFKAFSINGVKINKFKPHPIKKELYLAQTSTQCLNNISKQSKQPCFSYSQLYLSQNYGKTWELLTKYVSQFSWGYFEQYNNQIPIQRIYWIEETKNNKNQNRNPLIESRNFYLSDDFLITKQLLIQKGNAFYLHKNYLYVAQLQSKDTLAIQLLVSNPSLKDQKFRQIRLQEELLNHKFSILDAEEGQVFLNVSHLGLTSPLGKLYISDSSGINFSSSLNGQVRSDNGRVDFERLEGIYGIYISNIFTKEKTDHITKIYSREDTQDNHLEIDNSHSQILKDLQKIETMITFDKGAIWQRIPKPKNENTCKGLNCNLNIHSSSNTLYNSFYSSKNAIGLVFANGNVGPYLLHDKENVNTYISRDAGLTWYELKKGAYVFEIGDHGSIIVIGKDKDYSKTKEVEYSLDEGQTWTKIQVSEEEIQIENIITEPNNTSTTFIVIGRIDKLINNEIHEVGVVITIDFSNVFSEKCTNEDYEQWTPHGYQNKQCLMGKKVTYLRRKLDSLCLNGEQFQRIVNEQTCECTEEDWECDFGYERQGQGPCIAEKDYFFKPPKPEQCDKYYFEPTGYRKIAGNNCQRGVDRSPVQKKCPGKGILGVLMKVLFIVGSFGFVIYLRKSLVYLAILSFEQVKEIIWKKKDYIDFSGVKQEDDDKQNDEYANYLKKRQKKNYFDDNL
ncbi:hypothetical protein IMG5_146640 [Ichthyophthirius multifiliis]|uniref:VPS10 domain-containing protein n=1 Tax=Ichthyophthirius multifiliis TaxID=5932 RepID=G0QY22_ICHMU|nr:hypothetical protein IMG5_146640 [Ichthyophthirius multifiliis]EGR29891.1 hypothetical protein IMG5_146640 [Ichthyophthirius multifiliis]|eukprot:XP_004031127.1 hypothetical protein IMG5_146640 [Ichthyophthirius multifiliis]